MLILSLILSGSLLLIVNLIARHHRYAAAPIVAVSLAFLLCPPFFLALVFPPVMLQALILCGAVIVWRVTGRGPRFFTALSLGSTVAALAICGWAALQTEQEYARLRARYPFESMQERLAPMRPSAAKLVLASASGERVDRLEQELSSRESDYRALTLRRLHEHAVELFVNSPGFGDGRMMRPNGSLLARSLRTEPVPLQPGPRTPSAWSPGNGEEPPPGLESPLGKVLETSIVDFVNPRGFGYLKDRQHVAGFETHRFSHVPEPAERWKVETLELVSLLLHDEPAVYVSDHLPRMEPRADVPTRPIDRFEGFGLRALRQGEDLFIGRDGDGLRMVGAVRSTTQCVRCHECQRGELLGAFSYSLKFDGGEPASKSE